MRYPCARLTRPSCIRWSNHYANVCRAAAILRAACISWMEDSTTSGGMASTCDIPRLVLDVCVAFLCAMYKNPSALAAT